MSSAAEAGRRSSCGTRRHSAAMIIAVCVTSVAVAALAACATHDDSTGGRSALVGAVWSITTVRTGTTTTTVPADPGGGQFNPYTLYFQADGRWGAADQVTAYQGRYRIAGTTVTAYGSDHQPAGPDPAADTTSDAVGVVLSSLTSGTPGRFDVAGTALTLRVGSNTLTASRPSVDSSPIVGRSWRVTEVEHGGTRRRMVQGTIDATPTPVLTFARSGVVSLVDGVYARDGHYTTTASTVQVTDVRSHPIAPVDEPSRALLDHGLRALETPGARAHLAVTGSTLTLTVGGYVLIATRLATEPAPSPSPVFPQPTAGKPAFVGYAWVITTVHDHGKAFAIPASLDGGLTFTDHGQFVGSDGVNGQGGTYQLTTDGYVARNLTDSGVGAATTNPVRLALIDAVRAVEAGETDVVAHVSGTTLTVSAGGYRVTARRGERVRDIEQLTVITDPARLVGVTWTLTGISEQPDEVGGRPTYQKPNAAMTFTIRGPASISRPASSGCAGAMVSLGPGRIDVSPQGWAVSTQSRCPTPQLTGEQGAFFFRVLTQGVFFSILGDTLTIARAGVGSLRFHR